MNGYPSLPMMLGAAAAASVRLIVWRKACQHQVEPDPAEMAARYGAETPVLDWRAFAAPSLAYTHPCQRFA